MSQTPQAELESAKQPTRTRFKRISALNFKRIPLEKVNEWLQMIYHKTDIEFNPFASKEEAVNKLSDIMNEGLFYTHEGVMLEDYKIVNFMRRIEQTWPSGFNSFRSINPNYRLVSRTTSNPTPDVEPLEYFPDITFDSAGEPEIVNNNFNDSSIFSQNQMIPQQVQAQAQQAEQNRNLIMALLSRVNSISAQPINPNEVPPDPNQALQFLVQRLLNTPTTHFGGGVAKPKSGMTDLAKIVLNLQRDIKRVAKAISPQGAQQIVDKHNATSNSRWTLEHRDINGDNIPDVVIRNAANDPLYINGYTTTKSDWPTKYHYHHAYPTREARKDKPYDEYKSELYNINYAEDWDGNLHNMGKFQSGDIPQAWAEARYNLDNYRTPNFKDKSAYARFRDYVIKPISDNVINQLENARVLLLNGTKYKISVVAKAVAKVWKQLVLHQVQVRTGIDPDSVDFKKWKNKRESKQYLNNLVSDLLNHLHRTNAQLDWTEEKRAGLLNHVAHQYAQALIDSVNEINNNAVLHGDGHNAEYNPEQLNAPAEEHVGGGWTQEHDGDFGDEDFMG